MEEKQVSSATLLAERIDALLPQTQCTKCGYDGCAPYAAAIASGEAAYNRCPPGGAEGIARLAELLHAPRLPLDTSHGEERPRPLAVIDESLCIGCTLCMQACPVDAIVGAGKRMHTVLADWCTGCDLCVAPCPVDCIDMVPMTGEATGWQAWSPQQAALARERYVRRGKRLAATQAERQARNAQRAVQMPQAAADDPAAAKRQALVAAAVERAARLRAAAEAARAKPGKPS